MSDEDPDDIFKNSKNRFVRFYVFCYKLLDVPVTAFKGNHMGCNSKANIAYRVYIRQVAAGVTKYRTGPKYSDILH